MARPRNCTHGNRWVLGDKQDICSHPKCWDDTVSGTMKRSDLGRKTLGMLRANDIYEDFCQQYFMMILSAMQKNREASGYVYSPLVTIGRALDFLNQHNRRITPLISLDPVSSDSEEGRAWSAMFERSLGEAMDDHIAAISLSAYWHREHREIHNALQIHQIVLEMGFDSLLLWLRGDVTYQDALKIENAKNGLSLSEAMEKLQYEREFVQSHVQFGVSNATV